MHSFICNRIFLVVKLVDEKASDFLCFSCNDAQFVSFFMQVRHANDILAGIWERTIRQLTIILAYFPCFLAGSCNYLKEISLLHGKEILDANVKKILHKSYTLHGISSKT